MLRCGAPRPQLPPELASAPVIETPVRSAYAGSTSQLPMIVDVGAVDALTGVAAPDYVSTAEVRARIDAGTVRGFAADGQLDTEAVLAAAPSVLLSEVSTTRRSPPCVPGVCPSSAGPTTVMGALTGHEADAERVFAGIEQRYGAAKAAVAGVAPTPVLIGASYQGTWNVPTGGSTTGTLVGDAGGTWSQAANHAAGSVPTSLEVVFASDGAAPIWLTDGPLPRRSDAVALDPRYGELAAVRTGQVWTRDLRTTPGGGPDAFERGVTHPDELLGDLVAILHPDGCRGTCSCSSGERPSDAQDVAAGPRRRGAGAVRAGGGVGVRWRSRSPTPSGCWSGPSRPIPAGRW